jgi:hypothetical protein
MRRSRKDAADLSFALAALWRDAAQTIAWRSWMMASGRCSAAEYRRMASEKYRALIETGLALGQTLPVATWSAALRPWRRRASANARRLRRR